MFPAKSITHAVGAVLLASAAMTAQAAPCPDRIGNVIVTSAQIAPELNVEESADSLTKRAEASRPGFADGITDVQFGYNVELSPGELIEGCKSWDVTARLLTTTAIVYIANDVPEKSCRWNALMDHELKHVQIAQRALDSGVTILRERLARSKGTFTAPDKNARPGTIELRPWLQTQAVKALEMTLSQYRKNNENLDKPREATRLADMCDTSIQFFMGNDMKRVK